MHQAIARRLSSATTSGSLRSSSLRSSSTEQVVVAIPLALADRAARRSRSSRSSVSSVSCRSASSGARRRTDRPHMRSSTEVYLRNCASAAGSRERSSRRKYSDTKPVVAGEARGARRARRARLHRQRREVQAGRPALRPLGQLGQLARVELDSRSLQQQPGLLLVEPEVGHADLVRPCPCARQRASGSAGSSRLAIAICEPAGTYSNSAASTSRQDGFATACRSSSTSTSGRSSAASAPPTRGTRFDQVDPPGPDSASNTSGATGSTR